MDRRTKEENPDGLGSVKAAISLYGQKFNAKSKRGFASKSGELHIAQLDMGRLKETEKSAENEKARAELEIIKAQSAAQELALQIEQSNAGAEAWKLKLQPNGQEYSELMGELSNMKQELTRLKLDVAAALESKSKAETIIEETNFRVKSLLKSAEVMNKEIEEGNEEHVLVALARIEAERECREIEAQREEEATQFSEKIMAVKEKIIALQKEVDQAKVLERKLAITTSDLSVLESEMVLVQAMERNSKPESSSSPLKSLQDELQASQRELARIREEGFQFMGSMDVIRKEMILIAKGMEELKNQEKRSETSIQQLNLRLLKAKSKLEAATASEQRAEAIVSNLSDAFQKLKTEIEEVWKEKDLIFEETKTIKSKTHLIEIESGSIEEKLKAAISELETGKATEATAVKKLRDVSERTMKNRVSSLGKISTVTVSKSEYEYLIKGAESAQLVAEKKVGAARAWVEALKAEEREIQMKTELVLKEIEGLKVEEEKAKNRSKNNEEELQIEIETPRRSVRESRVSMAAARKARMRRSSISSGIRYNPQSPSFTIKKRKTVMPNLVKFLRKGSNRASTG